MRPVPCDALLPSTILTGTGELPAARLADSKVPDSAEERVTTTISVAALRGQALVCRSEVGRRRLRSRGQVVRRREHGVELGGPKVDPVREVLVADVNREWHHAHIEGRKRLWTQVARTVGHNPDSRHEDSLV